VRIVLDTNVLISGLLSPFGNCGEIVRMLTSDEIILCVDSRILVEYSEVLHRPRFGIDQQMAAIVYEYIQASSETHASVPLETPLPDESDSPFLEVALSSGAECLVTGNLKHFPMRYRAGVRVLSPKEFLDFFRRHRTL
jgi:putative PIN family toxin of toxin-antitoxin system